MGVLEGARAKVNRAREQTDSLRDELQRFYDSEPYAVRQTLNAETRRKVATYHVTSPDDVRWSIVFGEIVHDLRTALDHAIYELTVIETGGPLDQTEFPVFEDEDKYDATTKKGEPARGSGVHKVRGINDEAKRLVRALQPFEMRKGPSDEPTALAVLHELNIIDKHRTIYVVRRRTTEGFFLVVRDIQTPIEWMPPLGELEEGAKLGEWTPTVFDDEPDMEIKVGIEIALGDFEIAFSGAPLIVKDQPLIGTCERLIVATDKILNYLIATIRSIPAAASTEKG